LALIYLNQEGVQPGVVYAIGLAQSSLSKDGATVVSDERVYTADARTIFGAGETVHKEIYLYRTQLLIGAFTLFVEAKDTEGSFLVIRLSIKR
jgi:hypothetical protein